MHYLIENEYEILAEYAHGDGATEIDFEDFVELEHADQLYDNCVNEEDEDPLSIVRNQIDMALDLLPIAKSIGDEEWEEQLKKRLVVLSQRYSKLRNKNKLGRL